MPIATPQGTLDFKSVDKVTFVGASSNTVIDTTTGSLGVGVDVNGPTSNLHVVGNTRLEGDIDMLHTANTASIKLNSNVVTEFPRSKKLMKFPRVVLNSASQDGYVVTASTDGYVSTKFHRYDPFRPFVSGTGTNSANGWHSGPPDISIANNWDQTFDTSGYNKDVTSYGVGGYAGTSIAGIESEWLKLELPHKIVLSHFYYQQRDGQSINYGQAPRDFRILGSNDDVDWDTIQTFTDQTSLPEGKILTAEASKGYKYLAFVVTKTWVTSGTSHLTLKNLEYYGVPEYDPEAHGTDVVVKSIPNVPNTDWLEVYYDAKNYSGSGNVQDETANNSDGTLNSVTFDNSEIQSFNIPDGGNISATLATIPSGDFVHSVSIWVKFEDDTMTTSFPYAYFLGNTSSYSGFGLFFAGAARPNRLHVSCWTLDYPINFTFSNDTWYHVAYTYSGGGWTRNASIKAYVNGIQYGFGTNWSTGTEGTTPTIPTSNVPLRLGTNSTGGSFDGKIANFRLFNRALTSDEIYQLYAYQKEYFGHGDLSVTLKNGRLGIGTLEPRAALGVRGDVQVDGIITSNNPAFHVYRDAGDITTTDTTIVWNQVRFNRGSCYDSSTGIFRPLVDGMYYFSVFGMSDAHINTVCSFRFEHAPPGETTFTIIGALWPYQYVAASNSSHIHASGSFVYYLEAGSQFRVLFHGTELLARGNSHNGFSGFLIG